jgi:hypothetical protein
MAQWEYRVIHINVDNNRPPEAPNPQVASQKLHGALSAEFISREFPEQYGPAAAQVPKHPAEQLQYFLNLLGKEGWEMVEAAQVGPLLMFFFKRARRPVPAKLPPAGPATQAP